MGGRAGLCAPVLLAVLALAPSRAAAVDFRLDYAWDLNGALVETGRVLCTETDDCKLRTGISASFSYPHHARLRMNDLLFAEASHETFVPIDGRKYILGVFQGRLRQGNELVVNPRVGALTVVVTATDPRSPK